MVEELEVKKVPLELIKFDEANPNILSKEQMNALKLTMEKFGYLAPVILNKDFTVIDGEHRVRIYQDLGKKEIQAYVIDVDTIDLKILRQLMNKLRGEHDKQKDSFEFKSIYDSGRLDEFAKLLAQPREDFEAILSKKFDIDFIQEKDEIPELSRETKVKLGDIYQLGNHRVMCGDSTISLDVLLDGKMADLLLTDPPYGVSYQKKQNTILKGKNYNKISNDELKGLDLKDFFDKIFSQMSLFLKDTGSYYICSPQGGLQMMMMMMMDKNNIPLKHELIWIKPSPVFSMGRLDYDYQHEPILYGWKGSHEFNGSGKFKKSIWQINRDSDKSHPTMKPVELMLNAIMNSSKESMIVLDPFLGSGSTLIACESSNRICYGMELDPYYIDVIITRWENYTGKKAVKISSNTD